MISYRVTRRHLASRRREKKRAGLVIGIDLDGVLANQIHGIIPRVRERLGVHLSYEDVDKWRLPLGESDIAKEIEIAFGDSDYVLGMPVHSGAREFVDKLCVNNKVVILTARPSRTNPWTYQWLYNHGFTFDELVNVKEESKSTYRSDVLIDDYIGNAEEYLSNTCGRAILVDQPWNRKERGKLQQWIDAGRLYVVKDIRDGSEIVERLRRCRANREQWESPGSATKGSGNASSGGATSFGEVTGA